MAQLTEEMKVLVTAEVDKAIKNLKNVDKQTNILEEKFKKLGKSISAAFIAKTILDFSKASIAAYEQQNTEINVLNATIKATGATAWTSSKQLQDMADSLQKVTNYSGGSIQQMQAVLLGFKNIKGDNFTQATNAILDMATVMRMDLSSAAQTVGKALDDPINGITSLQRQGFRFSDSQKQVIESLINTGDMAAAQKIILDELNTTYGGAAEAAQTASAQIKNAWNDLQTGIGEFNTGFFSNKSGNNLVSFLQETGEAFGNFHDNTAFLNAQNGNLEDFMSWYTNLDNSEHGDWADGENRKLEAAKVRIRELSEQMKRFDEIDLSTWDDSNIAATDSFVDSLNLKGGELEKYVSKGVKSLSDLKAAIAEEKAMWEEEAQMLEDIDNFDKQRAQRESDRIAAETAVNELMQQISAEYATLAKDDPEKQLEAYQNQLEKIAENMEKLKKSTAKDSDGNLINTSAALEQLEYSKTAIEKKIQELRDKIQDDGKKCWKKYFADVADISEGDFATGKQGAELYIKNLENAFSNAGSLSAILGKKFDAAGFIESQIGDLEDAISTLLNIPGDKIDEIFTSGDDSIKALLEKLKELNKQKKEFEVVESLEDLQNQVDNLGKSETELYLIQLKKNGATDEQIAKARELRGILDNSKTAIDDLTETTTSFEDALTEALTEGIENLNLFGEEAKAANVAVASLGAGLISTGINATMSGLQTLGKTLGEGATASESLSSALADMAQEILNQLPNMFLQAGLQLIAQGQWALGLGLIAAAGTTAVTAGYVNGKTESNAMGGVYGDSSYQAFAKGGTFTNQIVSKPTFFKFKNGSGFGTGLMGEAGPEAIMPLTRGADGSLGVEASGLSGSSNVAVLVTVNNYSNESVTAKETTGDNGQKQLEITVGALINTHIANGKADKALASRYGLKTQGF